MPTQLPPDLSIGAIFPREDPRDALVVRADLAETYKSLAALPEGSVIGTSSLRRSAQLKRLYPHLRFADMRGNVGTRLSKLDAEGSQYAALILAAAGLIRVGMGNRITAALSKKDGGMLHAVGQGAIGVEVRSGDDEVKRLLEKVGCERTTRACLAERSLMRTLEGGCSVPIGVETEWGRRSKTHRVATGVQPAADYDHMTGEAKEEGEEETDELTFRAIVVSLDGKQYVEAQRTQIITTREDADQFGWTIAQELVSKGADKILEEINLDRGIIQEQGGA
ncbi:hypothetical protein LTS18_002921 [Coniosporium uncinatum]|uniref:Uncharacterized protein n=1 Tax=Coniosporium uncinatum TaxID=93489 RepID=A0ACC3D7F3_9PEZI|nr:hypothetical protein LTS18_002921 [Coniosporium uncinatum]